MNGKCECGAVTFTTPTARLIASYYCHCHGCRRSSGSPFGASALFPRFSLPEDAPVGVFEKHDTESGNVKKCYYCTTCGSRVLNDTGGAHVSVKAGTLEEFDWNISVHIFAKCAVAPVPEGAIMFDTQPAGSELKELLAKLAQETDS